MRLWSIHPCYLDSKGLVALWREGLLAQAVLSGETKGYKNHPQLARFKATSDPVVFIAAYLNKVHIESITRGYHFDESKIRRTELVNPLTVTDGQIEYEWGHLLAKLQIRDPDRNKQFRSIKKPLPHPIFRVIKGDVAPWEVLTP